VIQAKRRHFHNTKHSFISQVNLNDAPAHDVLTDDSKESQVRELGESIKEIELKGNYFGQFSLTVVIYDLDPAKVDRACAEFYKVFSVHDAQLYEEKYNLLNAFLATILTCVPCIFSIPITRIIPFSSLSTVASLTTGISVRNIWRSSKQTTTHLTFSTSIITTWPTP
jgi:type IV secretory pathway VirB4 component